MALQFVQKEWNDFYIAAISKDRSNEIEIGQWIRNNNNNNNNNNNTQKQRQLTIGKTLGCVIAISTYNNCCWIYQFFLPIILFHISISSILSLLLDDKGYSFTVLDDTPYIHNNYGTTITNNRGVIIISTITTLSTILYYFGMILHLFLILITTCTMIYGISTIFSNKISTNQYKNNTSQPPSYMKCILQTIHYSSINILIVVILLFIPISIVVQIISNTEYYIDDYLFFYLGTIVSPYSTIHLVLYYTTIVFEIVFILCFFYYSILCLVLVLPCTILERISNPFYALYRSYQLTKDQSLNIIILSLISLINLGIIETFIVSLRHNTIQTYYDDHYYNTDTSNRDIYKWVLCKILISIPDLFFIPYIAIFQTVIYCNLCSIGDIVADKKSGSITTGSMLSH